MGGGVLLPFLRRPSWGNLASEMRAGRPFYVSPLGYESPVVLLGGRGFQTSGCYSHCPRRPSFDNLYTAVSRSSTPHLSKRVRL
jgi:hypothetical protein